MYRSLLRSFLMLAAVIAALPLCNISAQDEPAAAEPAATAEEDAVEAPKVDLFAIPENATKEQLIEVIGRLINYQPDSLETYNEYRQKAPVVLEDAAQQLMKAVEDKTSFEFLQAQGLYLQLRASKLTKVGPEEAKQIIDQLIAFFSDRKLDVTDLKLANSLANSMEMSGANESAQRFCAHLAKVFSTNDDERIVEYSKSFAGMARRLGLVGNEMKIEGTTVDGQPFNIDDYKGKVVLVDFWATWCGPCIQEIPNVLANYEKFHDKGFEVVAICLDDERSAVEEFLAGNELPWVCLFQDGAGFEQPTAAYYGISSIPQVILIGKDGKVVDIEARGPRLGELLEQLLGDKS